MISLAMTASASYPSPEYHAEQDRIFEQFSGPIRYAFVEVNDYIELMALAVPDEAGKSYREPNLEEFVDVLVQLHNRCIDNINKGQSVARYSAILAETRLRMKGAIVPDNVLDRVPGLLHLAV